VAPFGEETAQSLQRAWAEHLGRKVVEEVDLGGGVTMAFVLIPPGTFRMGSPEDEAERRDNERQREVTISRPLYLGQYEVTQEQYERLTGKTPSWFSATGPGKAAVAGQDTRRFPVEQVSWGDAAACCERLRRKAGRAARLPSEAEWEYACRAGTTRRFPWGQELNGAEANCDGHEPCGTPTKGPFLWRTCRVGSYRPNAWGLYDMQGNVWEWCADRFGPGDGLPGTDPVRPARGPENVRVLRGGSWLEPAACCRAALRYGRAPTDAGHDVGFRVAFGVD
jgi:formylglycine-generating enzyme required for sulfatase activity